MTRRRDVIELGDKEALLQPASTKLLLKLIEARRASPGGWEVVPPTTANRKAVSRLREDLRALDPEGRSWIENDGRGRYRLTAACPPINLSTDQGETP